MTAPRDDHIPTGPSPPEVAGEEEDIDEELAAGDGTLSETLRSLLRAPDDFEERVADTVSEQLVGASSSAIGLDLLALGARTLAFFLSAGAPPADRSDGSDQEAVTGRRARR